MWRHFCGSVLVLASINTAIRAAEPLSVDEARQVITRSLPFIESEGVAWKDKRKCVTCHQVSNLVWTFNEGRRHGFEVNAEQLKGWNEWSLNNAFGNNQFYRLTKAALEKLATDGLSPEVIDKLRPLVDQEFITEADYLGAIGERIAPELTREHSNIILQASAKPGVGPGADPGPSAVYSVMLRSGAPAQTADPARSLAVVFEGLRATQQDDGLWRSSNQFLAMHRPKVESNVVNSMWIVWALAQHEPLPPSMQQARERALAAIAKAERGATTES
ncbi:MAG: hypothetical protein JNM18_23080, partial [Planctomycetaceae bacterium]|nr:hypothetical protein [Planctomycetaceae bacterium]